MVRIVIEAGTDDAAEQLTRAVNLLSPKILLYSKTEHWLVVRKTEADAAVVALKHHGIAAVVERSLK